jgi:hypothetical protein
MLGCVSHPRPPNISWPKQALIEPFSLRPSESNQTTAK